MSSVINLHRKLKAIRTICVGLILKVTIGLLKMKCVHFSLTLFVDSGNCQIQGKMDKLSPAEKIKVHVIKEQMSQMLSPNLKCAAHTAAIDKHEIVFFGMGE